MQLEFLYYAWKPSIKLTSSSPSALYIPTRSVILIASTFVRIRRVFLFFLFSLQITTARGRRWRRLNTLPKASKYTPTQTWCIAAEKRFCGVFHRKLKTNERERFNHKKGSLTYNAICECDKEWFDSKWVHSHAMRTINAWKHFRIH